MRPAMFQLRLVAAFSLLITSLNAQPPTAGQIPRITLNEPKKDWNCSAQQCDQYSQPNALNATVASLSKVILIWRLATH